MDSAAQAISIRFVGETCRTGDYKVALPVTAISIRFVDETATSAGQAISIRFVVETG